MGKEHQVEVFCLRCNKSLYVADKEDFITRKVAYDTAISHSLSFSSEKHKVKIFLRERSRPI